MTATAADLAKLPADARRAVLADLSPEELSALEYTWSFWARPDQLPPAGDWRTWLYCAARAVGKTRALAEYIRNEVETGRHRSIAIVGPTADAIRRDMIEGSSGLLRAGHLHAGWRWRWRKDWNHDACIKWPNHADHSGCA